MKIKGTSNATIGQAMITTHRYKNAENVSFNQFSIAINASELLGGNVRDPRYRINPLSDKMVITITDLEGTRSAWNPRTNLTRVDFYQHSPGTTSLLFWSPPNSNYIYDDGNATLTRPPIAVRDSVSLAFGPEFSLSADPTGTLYVNLTFGMETPSPFLNNTLSTPFDYNYHPANVTQPELKDAVLEVAVW
ncbi:MAG: hypothetical protein METHP_00730 [Methanoregula sp. SKADARSKE-2]|nr:MAG: hypothetical protein METHP_00730 [Methanoregula sp. SKADARSKE-2]